MHNPQIIGLKIYGQNAFRVKMRATFTSTLIFQVWLNHNPQRTRYAYQLYSPDEPWIRWDNAPHYPDLKINFPHHFHNDQGGVKPSILQGDPLQDLLDVLGEIEDYYLVVD